MLKLLVMMCCLCWCCWWYWRYWCWCVVVCVLMITSMTSLTICCAAGCAVREQIYLRLSCQLPRHGWSLTCNVLPTWPSLRWLQHWPEGTSFKCVERCAVCHCLQCDTDCQTCMYVNVVCVHVCTVLCMHVTVVRCGDVCTTSNEWIFSPVTVVRCGDVEMYVQQVTNELSPLPL